MSASFVEGASLGPWTRERGDESLGPELTAPGDGDTRIRRGRLYEFEPQ